MEDFVPFELAKKLKEKGFTLPKSEIIGKFDSDGLFHSQLYINYTETMDSDEIIAPTISQVLKWLIEQKERYIVIQPFPTMATKNKICWSWDFKWNSDGVYMKYIFSGNVTYATYEKAALAGIEYVIDNLI
jgi:hypothetical protein